MKTTIWKTAVAVLLAAAASTAWAAWPDKPIRLIVPYPAGGGADLVGRTIAQKVGESLGQTVVVENRPGASTIIGTEALARAEPDGYTIGMLTDSHALNPALFPGKLPYDSKKDFAFVSQLVSVPFVLVASPKSGITSLSGLLEAARARPGGITYASIGMGSPHYLAMEYVKALAGVDLTHVPYTGVAPALSALLGSQVDVMFTGLSTGLPNVKAGRLAGLAVTTTRRSAIAPDLPTMSEAGLKEFTSFVTWYGMGAPAGTPPQLVERLSDEIRKALLSPDTQAKLADLGLEAAPSTPKAFAQFMNEETARYAQIVKLTGAKGE